MLFLLVYQYLENEVRLDRGSYLRFLNRHLPQPKHRFWENSKSFRKHQKLPPPVIFTCTKAHLFIYLDLFKSIVRGVRLKHFLAVFFLLQLSVLQPVTHATENKQSLGDRVKCRNCFSPDPGTWKPPHHDKVQLLRGNPITIQSGSLTTF